MSHQLGVAILGCGYWGINYVRVFDELPQTRVVAVCDQQTDRLQEVHERFPGVGLTTELKDLLNWNGIEAIILCTPAVTHYDLARACLEAGKHILIEKPITTRSGEAEALVNLAEARRVVLMVGHTFLYNPGIRKVKACIEQEELGRIYYLHARRTNLGPIRRDVNAIWDLAPHDVSIFNYFLNDTPQWVSATGSKVLHNCREDVGFISLGYADGIVGHIHVSWAEPNKVREVVVVGSNRRIVFDDLNNTEKVRIFEKGIVLAPSEAPSYGEYHFLVRDGDIISPRVEVSEPLKNQCSHFVECVIQGLQPLTNGKVGLEVVRVMEAIDQSVNLRGTPVELNVISSSVLSL